MHWLALTLILAASLCNAAPRCNELRLRKAAIRGDTINGAVVLRKKPLKFAHVRLYSSSGKTAFEETTDKNGTFKSTTMLPDNYRLEVTGWGSTTVELNPDLDKKSNGKNPVWDIILIDNACVVTRIRFE